jgi:DNA-binding IclR family transcriptional regulator
MTESRYTVTSLDRAFDVLEVLAERGDGQTLSNLSRITDIPKSTLFRILSTLQDRNCVSLDVDTKKYTLGLKLRELGSAFIEKTNLDSAAAPFMRDLADSCRESVFLALMDQAEIVYVRRMASPNSVMMVRKLGHRAPVHSTATGVAMLAFLPKERREEIIEKMNFTKHNSRTNTDPDELRKRLVDIRQEGVAVVDGEYNPELLCVSAPILGTGGTVEAAITVAMPSSEAPTDRVEAVKKEVREASFGISRQLGYVENSRSNHRTLSP